MTGREPSPLVSPVLRLGKVQDAERCGAICYEAFKRIAEEHNFPSGTPSPAAAIARFTKLLSHPGYYVVVAELDGRVVGSNVLDERSVIAGLGPTTVDPSVQNRMVGRQLLDVALQRVAERRFSGVRLVQAAHQGRSLSLYAKLGFQVREPLVTLQGPALGVSVPGRVVRTAAQNDLESCNALCRRIHGHDRNGELADAILTGTATLVEHESRVSGYATEIGYSGHAVGEANADIEALIGATTKFLGPGFLLPVRNAELFRWCLEHGLRVIQPMNLMSMGLYNEPQGAFLSSVIC
jgi:predicted N-acetyltransferase YhbS